MNPDDLTAFAALGQAVASVKPEKPGPAGPGRRKPARRRLDPASLNDGALVQQLMRAANLTPQMIAALAAPAQPNPQAGDGAMGMLAGLAPLLGGAKPEARR